jgi:RNA polymerase sigma factor (sigma-70 family)
MSEDTFIQLKNGCPSAFAHIHAKYSRNIFWVGKRLIEDEFVIETLVQDAFLKLWLHRDTVESPKHVFFFLRFVMKRECISYYTRPKNKFSRNVHSLERFENYQDYMAGYDPLAEEENLKVQNMAQEDFESFEKVLPLLNNESRRFIELCLKYGFQYKAIAQAMGMNIKETSVKIKRAISEIKDIIQKETVMEKPTVTLKTERTITEQQIEVLKLRCEGKLSFAEIATALDLSQREVHEEFMAAYKLSRDEHPSQPQSA